MIAVGVLLAAAIGALMRYELARWNAPGRPAGTLAVNVLAAFVAGILAGSSESVLTIVGVGYLGSLSTFSTVMHETADDYANGLRGRAVAYLGITVVLGVAAAAVGIELSS